MATSPFHSDWSITDRAGRNAGRVSFNAKIELVHSYRVAFSTVRVAIGSSREQEQGELLKRSKLRLGRKTNNAVSLPPTPVSVLTRPVLHPLPRLYRQQQEAQPKVHPAVQVGDGTLREATDHMMTFIISERHGHPTQCMILFLSVFSGAGPPQRRQHRRVPLVQEEAAADHGARHLAYAPLERRDSRPNLALWIVF